MDEPNARGSEPGGARDPGNGASDPGADAAGPNGSRGDESAARGDATEPVPTGLPLGERAAREAAGAFGVLADPLRVRILTTLWRTDRRGPVAYSDLKDAVGVRDSGRFNYHLSQLTGRFLEKTDDGYGLTATGLYVVDALAAGAFTDTPELPPEPTGVACPTCDGELHARYEGAEHIVQCPDCELVVNWLLFPPAGVRDRPREALPLAAAERSRRLFSMAHAGICPFCGREMDVELVTPNGGQFEPYGAAVEHDCGGCEGHVSSSLGAYLYDHPAVVAFRHDHGEAPGDEPFWAVDFVRDPAATAVASENPLRARLTVARGDERLELEVDADATVVAERRVRGA